MKRLLSSIFIALLVPLFFVQPAQAKVMVEENSPVVIGRDEVIDDDLFIGASTVDIQGVVNGDVYVGTSSFTLTGEVNGDLFVGASTVVIAGKVQDDLYVGSGNVTVTGAEIGDTAAFGAGQVVIDSDSSIGGSLLAGSGSFHNSAPVGRNVMVAGGDVNLDSAVGGEVKMGGGMLTLGPSSIIAGDLTYTLGEESTSLNMSDSASVAGETKRVEPSREFNQDTKIAQENFNKFGKAFSAGWSFLGYLGVLLVGLLTLRLLPKSSRSVTEILEKSTLRSLGIGFLAILVVMPAFFLLLVTGVGASLGFILLALFFVDLYFAKLVVGFAVGRFLSTQFKWKKMSVYLVFAIGLTVLTIAKAVPFVGPLVTLASVMAGMGALLSYYSRLAGK